MKKLSEFLSENKTDIDDYIARVYCERPKNINERAAWVREDSELYKWAIREGVQK